MSEARAEECLFGARGMTSLAARTARRRSTSTASNAPASPAAPSRDGAHRPDDADVRIVAGTAVVLDEHVRLGRFQRALYDRLATVQVSLPPLRERREDISIIAPAAFSAGRARATSRRSVTAPSPSSRTTTGRRTSATLVLSVAYEHSRGAVISAERIRTELGSRPRRHVAPGIVPLRQVERDYLLSVMQRCGGNQTLAARRLGIGRSTLLRHLHALGYNRPDEPIGIYARDVGTIPIAMSAGPSSTSSSSF
jgi:DNA-binding NtrC family response regulator